MFARIVELRSKRGKAREICNTINDKALPILRQQSGFVDEVTLISDAEPDRVLAISLWNSKADADRYHREQFQRISGLVQEFAEEPPHVRTFDVDTSTAHRIARGKAA